MKDLCCRRVGKWRVGNQEKGDEESGVKGMITKERRDQGGECEGRVETGGYERMLVDDERRSISSYQYS